MNPYKDYSWRNLLRLRDDYQSIVDVAVYKSYEWDIADEQLSLISDEINARYKERSDIVCK